MVWNKGNCGYNYIHIDKKLLHRYYIEDMLSVTKCAEKFGCSTKPIRDALVEYKIPTRDRSEATKGNQNCKGRILSKETKEKISNSQPYKGTHYQTNTGRTHFKKGNIPWSKGKSIIITDETRKKMIVGIKKCWKEDYEYMKSTRLRGKKHPAWNPHLEFQKRAKNYLHNIINWHEMIFERDNYTCWMCGSKGGELNAHHTIPFNEIISIFIGEYGEDMEKLKEYDGFVNTNYGITLCRECHKDLHWGG